MDFFKSVFSDESSPSNPADAADQDTAPAPTPVPAPTADQDFTSSAAIWSFGGLFKTIATKSESVIESYRRDLEELGSGLKKETSVIREVASRAVKDLPTSLEVGASVAQESLESVGQAIDVIGSTVWKSTAVIISQGKEALLELDPDSPEHAFTRNSISSPSGSQGLDVKKYSRFDTQLRAIQCDVETYCVEPEDLNDYGEWKLGFVLEEKSDEIENLINENEEIEKIHKEVVPAKVDDEGFWSRYFYKVHKLKQVEDARARLVKRAISGEEEDLSWDLDEEEEEGDGSKSKGGNSEKEQTGTSNIMGIDNEKKGLSGDSVISSEPNQEKLEASSEDRERPEGMNNYSSDSCKDSDVSVVSTQPSIPDEGWDEIEDIVENDETKAECVSTTDKDDVRKRLAATCFVDDEDLSWDIEEDDESPKA